MIREISPKTVTLAANGTHTLTLATLSGDCGFDAFLARGGASSVEEILHFIRELTASNGEFRMEEPHFGCSTMQVKGKNGYLFGRNFDWEDCNTLILESHPANGYASLTSVDTDFFVTPDGGFTHEQLLTAAYYAPLDGINRKGLCVAVNLLPDGEKIDQHTGKKNLTTTTALRLVLDKAATAEEAVALLREYDLHTSGTMRIHYMIADAEGHSLCLEFIDGVMSVVETSVMCNHYLTPGPYFGQARSNSIERQDKLAAALAKGESMTLTEVSEAMASVRHGTQWSIIYDQTELTAELRHRLDFNNPYRLSLLVGT